MELRSFWKCAETNLKKKKIKDLSWKVEEDSFRLGNFDAVSRLKKEISELYDKEERM